MTHPLLRRRLHTSITTITKPTMTRQYLKPSFPNHHLRRSESTTITPSSNEGISTAGSIFFTSLCVITFGLGTWQTQRYFEKIELCKKREEDLELEPLHWSQWQQSTRKESTQKDNAKSYRRVILRGAFQHSKQVLVGPRGPPPGALAESGPNSGRSGGGMSSSMQGYWVVTPFLVGDSTETALDERNGDVNKGWFGRLFSRQSEQIQQDALNNETTEKDQVWINRGWIPRHFIDKDSQILHPWEQPSGIVTLTAMESQMETAGRFSPPSRLEKSTGVQKLLWMDPTAMSEMINSPPDINPPLFVQIKDEEETALKYPARSSREYVGEFKVTPEVHAGYAATWFGLSGAGVVMTRKLLRRGR